MDSKTGIDSKSREGSKTRMGSKCRKRGIALALAAALMLSLGTENTAWAASPGQMLGTLAEELEDHIPFLHEIHRRLAHIPTVDPAIFTTAQATIPIVRDTLNRGYIRVTMDGEDVMDQVVPVQIGEDGTFYIPEDTLTCAINGRGYWESADAYCIENPMKTMRVDMARTRRIGETLLISLEQVEEAYGITANWNAREHILELADPEGLVTELPAYYDYRYAGRQTVVKDQGEVGLCWAAAGTTAVESALTPGIREEFSPEHMCFKSSFHVDVDEGGNELITLSYLTAWQGPVREADDPYGDLWSPDGLAAQYHIQEARVTEENRIDTIKKEVYRFGGVESEIYLDLDNEYDTSEYYTNGYAAWCCTDREDTNHSIVIIGWDDNFPSWKFKTRGIGDGAFICQNSWGDAFGEDGVFYVSYHDAGVGSSNVVYSDVQSAVNYDAIYQTDLCGWCGSIGYEEQEDAWMANIYCADLAPGYDAEVPAELLEAVGFYTTAENCTYEVFVLTDPDDIEALRDGNLRKTTLGETARLYADMDDASDYGYRLGNPAAAVGRCAEAGYYTVPISHPMELPKGSEYAVLVRLQTPGSDSGLAIEWDDEEDTPVDISDGEGYISAEGLYWISTEEEEECNVCLKAYTRAK